MILKTFCQGKPPVNIYS